MTMKTIQIFKDERDAGLEEALRSTAALSFYSPVKLVSYQPEHEKVLAKLEMSKLARAELAKATNLSQDDLHYLNTVLVTTGWNKNDDVFDPVETYIARATPEDKPFNYEHDCSDIIGHITGCSVFDAEMNPVNAVDADFSNLPSKFHIVTGGVLYKVWSKPELQERMDNVIAEIAKGEWYVSMECLFYGFDYALKSADGSQRVIARNEETAFLTKYLRAYGGTGEWKDGRIGRVLRNISFSGIGLVRQPANPESVVLDDPTIFDGRSVASESQEKISEKIIVPKNPVYSDVAQGSEQKTLESDMPTVEQLTAELAAANAEIESLKSATTTSAATIESLNKTIESTKSALTCAESNLAAANEAKAKIESEKVALATERDSLKASLEAANTELGTMKAAAKRVERLGVVASKLKINAEAAAKLVDGTSSLADEAFASHVDLMVSAIAAATPTPTPAPAQAAAKPVDTAPEVDAAEAGADTKKLDEATPGKTVAASIPVEESDEAGEVRAAIASYLKPEKKSK